MKKRIISLLLCILLCLTMTPLYAFADEQPEVKYLDENGEIQTLTEPYHLVSEWKNEPVWDPGWYVLDEDVTIGDQEDPAEPIEICAEVNLILTDGRTLTVYGGIMVNENESLTVYAQSEEEDTMGRLVARASGIMPGIGCKDYRDGGNITINGGFVEAYAGDCGREQAGAGIYGSNITVNGGVINAYGGNSEYSCGYGIYGDTVYFGAGKMTCKGGGNYDVEKAECGPAIGGELTCDLNVSAYDHQARCTKDWKDLTDRDCYVTLWRCKAVPYLCWNEAEPLECNDYSLIFDENDQEWDGWYVLDSDVTIGDPDNKDASIKVSGDAHIILKNGCVLFIYGGIQVPSDKSLVIYAQSDDEEEMGGLGAYGGEYAAGIGGNQYDSAGPITIMGGIVEAEGGNYAAGIGGGCNTHNNSVTIYDGLVLAIGSGAAAGIGGGYHGKGGSVSTYGGTILALGADYSDEYIEKAGTGIGDGADAPCAEATFNYYGGSLDAADFGFNDALRVSALNLSLKKGKALEIKADPELTVEGSPFKGDHVDIDLLKGYSDLHFRTVDADNRHNDPDKRGSATGPIVTKADNIESIAPEVGGDVNADPVQGSDTPDAGAVPFTDVTANDWFNGDVAYVYEKGLMEGVSADTFDPQGTVTRAQLAAMLYRAAKAEGNGFTGDWMFLLPYTDRADIPDYAYEAIAWCTMHDILKGYADGSFGPNDPITREQMAAILYRYAQYKGQGFAGASMFYLDYADAKDISEYAFEGMRWCVMKGIVGGVGEGLLAPQGNATRAQAAAVLHRFCEAE